jgi:hypothetical protein
MNVLGRSVVSPQALGNYKARGISIPIILFICIKIVCCGEMPSLLGAWLYVKPPSQHHGNFSPPFNDISRIPCHWKKLRRTILCVESTYDLILDAENIDLNQNLHPLRQEGHDGPISLTWVQKYSQLVVSDKKIFKVFPIQVYVKWSDP